MSKFMKMLNNISRSQAIYRNARVSADDLQAHHYAFVLTVCRYPGSSQEDIARKLCINKSTVARHLNFLEENGYITRISPKNDKRQFLVYPTEKMLSVLPEIEAASTEWMALLSEGISEQDLATFISVLERMQARAARIIEGGDEGK